MRNIKVKGLAIAEWILAIAGAALLIIAHYNPETYWLRDCVSLCTIALLGCAIIQISKSERSGKAAVDTKKVVLCTVAGAVLALAVIWIVLINVLSIGLE